MATYVALSTLNVHLSGWQELARASDRDTAEQAALETIDEQYPDRLNLYGDTLRKNLTVVSLTKARRLAGRCALGECDHDHDPEA